MIRWVEPRDWVDKNRTRCHILCDHCHKTWHIRDMWQGGDNVSRGWLSGKMIAKQDLNFVYNQLKGRGWDCSLELGHKATESVCVTTLLFVRDCVKAPGAARSDLGMNPVQRSRGLGYLFSPESRCQPSRAKWCNFNLIFNGAVSLRFLKTKLLFHSHIAFTEDNYSPSAILASLIVSSGKVRLELKLTG